MKIIQIRTDLSAEEPAPLAGPVAELKDHTGGMNFPGPTWAGAWTRLWKGWVGGALVPSGGHRGSWEARTGATFFLDIN